MTKPAVLNRILIVACAILVLIIVSASAYYFGMQRQAQTIELMKNEQAIREHDYAKSLQSVQAERDQATTNYQTACYEYQKLYAAYDGLYKIAGNATGVAKYSPPDAARGSETSCYR